MVQGFRSREECEGPGIAAKGWGQKSRCGSCGEPPKLAGGQQEYEYKKGCENLGAYGGER